MATDSTGPLPAGTYSLSAGGTLRGRALFRWSEGAVDQWWALSSRHRWGPVGATHELRRDAPPGSGDPRALLQAAAVSWAGASRYFRASGRAGAVEGPLAGGLRRLELDPGGMSLWFDGERIGHVRTVPSVLGSRDELWVVSAAFAQRGLGPGEALVLRTEIIGADVNLVEWAAEQAAAAGPTAWRLGLRSREASDLLSVLRL